MMIYFFTFYNFERVLAHKTILNPSLAKVKAKAFPIPSDEPVIKAQLFEPYLYLKFFLLRIVIL
jgi:hypothetical protein